MKRKSKFTYLATGTALLGTVSSLGASATNENEKLDESQKLGSFLGNEKKMVEVTASNVFDASGKKRHFLIDESLFSTKKNEEEGKDKVYEEEDDETEKFLKEEEKEKLDLIKEDISQTAKGEAEAKEEYEINETTPLLPQKPNDKKSSFWSELADEVRDLYATGRMLCSIAATVISSKLEKMTGGKTISEKIGGLAGWYLGFWKIPVLLSTFLGFGASTVFMIPCLASVGSGVLLHNLGVTKILTKVGKTLGGLVGKGLSKLFKRKSKNADEKSEKMPKNILERFGGIGVPGNNAQLNEMLSTINEGQLNEMLSTIDKDQLNEILKMSSGSQLGDLSQETSNGQIDFSKILKPFPDGNEEIPEIEGQAAQPSANKSSKDGNASSMPIKKQEKETVLKKVCKFCVTALACTAIGTGLTMGLGVPVTTSAAAAYGIYKMAPLALAAVVATPIIAFKIIKNIPGFVRGACSVTSSIGKAIIRKITGSKGNSAKEQNKGVNNLPINQLPSGLGLKI